MATTTFKLPVELEKRIARLAHRAGKTPRAWVVEALEREVELSEPREVFLRAAAESEAEVDAGGALYAAEGVHAYIRCRIAGKKVRRPTPINRRR